MNDLVSVCRLEQIYATRFGCLFYFKWHMKKYCPSDERARAMKYRYVRSSAINVASVWSDAKCEATPLVLNDARTIAREAHKFKTFEFYFSVKR